MQRIELSIDPRALTFQQVDLFGTKAAGADPDGIHPVIVQRLALLEPLGRNAAIETTNLEGHLSLPQEEVWCVEFGVTFTRSTLYIPPISGAAQEVDGDD